MSTYRDSVEGVLAALAILSPTSYSWFGSQAGQLPPETEAALDPGSARTYLVYQLQARLYGDFYCPGEARPSMPSPPSTVRLGPSPFIQALSEANSGSGSREAGWSVLAHDGGDVIVERGGLRLWAAPQELYASDDLPLQPGGLAGVLLPKELLRLSPGFYMALGNAEFPAPGAEELIRFYWNLVSDGAVTLVRLLTKTLNDAGLSFRLKVVSDRDGYLRSDAGVLYVPASSYEQTWEVVVAANSQLAPELKAGTPALTKPLARGLALAEDPTGGLGSFGMSRCELLAEAVVRAAEIGAATVPEQLEIVAQRFAEAGIELDAPYLNPGSLDRYVLP